MRVDFPYLRRGLELRLRRLFDHVPAVAVLGARQVGKSTLLLNAFEEVPRVVFDPVIDVEGVREDPHLFLQSRGAPLILDEVQYAPEVVAAIKYQLEQDRSPGRYLVTGSQQWEVIKNLSDSLAGRIALLELHPFSVREIAGAEDTENSWVDDWLTHSFKSVAPVKRASLKNNLYEQLWRGFLPEPQFLPDDIISSYYHSYRSTYVERDVRLQSDISDLAKFEKFYRLAGALSAQEINHSQLGRELDVTPQTAGRWLEILKATFQWFEIEAWSGNTVKRISGKPKGYLFDSGMICNSLAISTPSALAAHPNKGAVFETAVINDVIKACSLLQAKPNLYHWRAYSGAEVDLILERDGRLFPIEVKAKSNPSKRDASRLKAFRNAYPNANIHAGLILAPAENMYQVSENDFVLPWDTVSFDL